MTPTNPTLEVLLPWAAELCGLKLREIEPPCHTPDGKRVHNYVLPRGDEPWDNCVFCSTANWRPDEKADQMMMVIEAMRKIGYGTEISDFGGTWLVTFSDDRPIDHTASNSVLAAAVLRAAWGAMRG